jgi:poly-gamma-glutamate capsule biosynthesis protein CapA/YwtB (metallophosphatase superfamily)
VTAAFTFAATGDAIVAPSTTATHVDDDISTLLAGADAAATQVEPVLIDGECQHASLRQVRDQYQYPASFPGAIMGTDPTVLDTLAEMGLNCFTAASNHANDFGQDGLTTTLDAFRERDLPVAGIGTELAAAREPAYVDTPAGRVGVVDATTSVPPGAEAGVPTAEFPGQAGVSPLHVEWTYRLPPDQFDHLRAIAETVGIEAVKGEWLRRDNPDWAADEAFYFMQMRVAPATAEAQVGISHHLHDRDRAAVLDAIRIADESADWVVAAVHAHHASGGGRNTGETPPFLREFARDCVDAGADTFVGTGPHALRGIELYDGAPLCYSLGNLFFQESTVYRVPDVCGESVGETVPDVRGGDSDDDVAHDADNWESVIPECEFGADGNLDRLTIHPVTLRPRADPPHRGAPACASGSRARSILETVARRSEPFGTRIRIDGDVGCVAV